MNLLATLTTLEENEDLHLARILILLYAFAGENGQGRVEGLTKLAKLDFLLRYPEYLEKALLVKNASTKKLIIKEHERKSIESTMVRYRYGPWDFRYRKFLNILVAKGLAKVEVEGKTILIGLSSTGLQVANKLANNYAFQDILPRTQLLKTNFDVKATTLMRFIYDTFPEISSLRLGEEIVK
jgi:hypothetical protein